MAPYIFNRDYKASIRLNYQHWAIKQLCGYLLHPDIPTGHVRRIADIGSGTAIWPVEVSQHLGPHVQIDAFDVSPAQYGPTEWMPSNVRLHAHDAFLPFPEEHLGQYDVVNVRFFVTLLNGDNVRRFIQHVVALLKPGGYLQWLDANPSTAKAVSIDPSASKSATEKLVALMRKPRPDASYDWISSLPSFYQSDDTIQMETVVHQVLSQASFGPSRMAWNQSYLLGYEEFYANMVAKGAASNDLEAAANFMDELVKEMTTGVSMEVQYFCLVGRKREQHHNDESNQ